MTYTLRNPQWHVRDTDREGGGREEKVTKDCNSTILAVA
jgi:hypothetical protein